MLQTRNLRSREGAEVTELLTGVDPEVWLWNEAGQVAQRPGWAGSMRKKRTRGWERVRKKRQERSENSQKALIMSPNKTTQGRHLDGLFLKI